MKQLFTAVLALASLLAASVAMAGADDILGVWLTDQKESKVKITKCGDAYCGNIVWLKTSTYPADHELAGKELMDRNNDDESKRKRPIMGLPILTGLKYDADDNEWTDGKVYSPRKGESYDATLELKDAELVQNGLLEVTGSVMLFSKTVTWTRD